MDAQQAPEEAADTELFQQVADELQAAGCYQQALEFHVILLNVPEYATAVLLLNMGICYARQNMHSDAEQSFQQAIQLDESNIEARKELVAMYEQLGEPEEALVYLEEIRTVRMTTRSTTKAAPVPAPLPFHRARPRYLPRRLGPAMDREKQEQLRTAELGEVYIVMRENQQAMRDGDEEATSAWADCAKQLTSDFRAYRDFYPWEYKAHAHRNKTGDEDTKWTNVKTEPEIDDLSVVQERISKGVHFSCRVNGANEAQVSMPSEVPT